MHVELPHFHQNLVKALCFQMACSSFTFRFLLYEALNLGSSVLPVCLKVSIYAENVTILSTKESMYGIFAMIGMYLIAKMRTLDPG